MSEARFWDFVNVSPRWISSHFFPTLVLMLSIHPADAGDRGDLPIFWDVGPSADLGEGLESESFDLRRRCAFGNFGEEMSSASARIGFPSSVHDESSSTGSSCVSADINDEADDCDSLWLADVEVEDVETELMLCVAACFFAAFLIAAAEAIVARDTVAIPEMGTAGGENAGGDDGSDAERSSPAAMSRTPSLIAAFAVGMMEETATEDALFGADDRLGVCGDAYARSMPRLTMRSHLRLRSASSDSCTASWERSSRHLDSFCAMNCSRSACFSVRVSGPWSTAGPGDIGGVASFVSDPRLLLSPFPRPAFNPSTVQMPIEFVLFAAALSLDETIGDRRSTWSLEKYEMDDCRRGFGALKLRALGGGVESPSDEDVRGDSIGETGPAATLLSSNCSGRGPTVGEVTAGEFGTALILWAARGIVMTVCIQHV